MDVATNFPLICQRLFNAPLVLRPEKAEMLRLFMAQRLGAAAPVNFEIIEEDERDTRRAYAVTQGIAIIPICGTLVQKLGSARPWCGMLGYDSIRKNFADALNDPEVDGILLDIDSPGGEVAGCFDLVDAMYGARGIKPVWASINECCCSGAYAVGSIADRMDIAGTGVTGSIGVVWMHVDWSKFNAMKGVDVTYVTYGDRKVDGNPNFPLGDEALARIQAQIDAVGNRFVVTAARNRDLDPDAVEALQAGVFMGADAVKAGLADTVRPIEQTFAAFQTFLANQE